MTVVAGFELDGHPLVFADLLLSRKQETDFVSPTVGKIAAADQVGRGGYYACGLKQKVCIISRDLVVAWTGNSEQAADALENLELDAAHYAEASDEELLDMFSRVWRKGELHFVACRVRREGDRHRLSWISSIDVKKWNKEGFGKAWVDGSGTNDFIQILDQRNVVNQQKPSFHVSLERVVSYGASMLAYELRRQQMSPDSYGAGFEVAYYGEDGWQKLNDMNFLVWTTDHWKVRLSNRFWDYQYIDHDLIIRVPEQEANLAPGAPTCFLVRPLGMQQEFDLSRQRELPDFGGGQVLVHMVLFGNGHMVYVTLHDCDNRNEWVWPEAVTEIEDGCAVKSSVVIHEDVAIKLNQLVAESIASRERERDR